MLKVYETDLVENDGHDLRLSRLASTSMELVMSALYEGNLTLRAQPFPSIANLNGIFT